MDNTTVHSSQPSVTSNSTSDGKRRSSLIEHEYMFNAIPVGRPSSRPLPSGKISDEIADPSSTHDGGDGKGDTNGGTSTASPTDAKKNKDADVTRQQLYKEAVYTCAHYLGTPTPQRFPAAQEEICLYAHEIFSENQKEQEAVLDHVRNEPFPLTIVNTKVKRAKGLHGSKANTAVDPYCIVTIETEDSLARREWQEFSVESPIVRHHHLKSKHFKPQAEARTSQVYEKVPSTIKTVVQRHRADPTWDQRFQCLSLRPSVDKLTVEIWDHSVDNTYVAKAIRNYDELGDVPDLDASLKTAHANTERKLGDVFLGKVSIKVAEIPCEGLDLWYPLGGTPHTKDKEAHGKVRLQIWLVHAYRHGRHFTEVAEPKIMLGHLWDWVLKVEKTKFPDTTQWDGSIPSAATCMLFQYALQNGISEDTHAIIRWNAYAKHDLGLPGLAGLKGVMEKAQADDDGKLPPHIVDSQKDVEDNVLIMVKDKICPIIRNHLNETVERVHGALASYQSCVEILQKYDNQALLQKILWLVHAAMRMCILEWYQRTYAKCVPSHGQVEKGQYVSSVVNVIKEVNALIRLGEMKWSPEFWLTANLEYLPIIYDELQKMVIHDVEAICWLFFRFYNDHRKLRKILMINEERDKLFCVSFFNLYKQTQTFVFAQVDIYKGVAEYPFLENYHRWFRPILVLWLGFALIRGSLMICKTINIDTNHRESPCASSMTSSSALDTATVFAQLVQFWSTLRWPDVPEGYVIINFLMDVMCSYTVLYAELKHAKLDKEGYYDPHGRFTISERLCIALNNIEHVKEHLQSIPQEIDYENLNKLLEDACGKAPSVLRYEENAQMRLDKTLMIVDKHIDDILTNVGIRIQKEIYAFIKESFTALMAAKEDRLTDAMEPIIAYLEDNIVVLQKSLLPLNFHKVLQMLWDLVCLDLHDNSIRWKMSNAESQVVFFKRVIQIIPYLQSYFAGGDAGLKGEEMETHMYQDTYNLFTAFTMDTDELIMMYYHKRAQFHLNFKEKSKLGTLRVRVGYWNNRLGVEVLSCFNLTPHDQELTVLKYFHTTHPTSDAMVELELRPAIHFLNEKKYTTTVQWKNLNPIFEESFYWSVTQEDCTKRSAVLVFTVKDYDLLSKNSFLGEAIVPLHVIPGISQTPEAQPMLLQLHEVDKEDHALLVLQSRQWDANAKQFSDDQLGKFVEPVVKKK